MENKNSKIYNGYCVYLHVNDVSGNIFYVGKGKGGRPWVASKSTRSTKWSNYVGKYGKFSVILLKTDLTEQEAFALECEKIAECLCNGIHLVNLTSGGEGFAGGSHSEEAINSIRKYHLVKSEPIGNNPRRGVYYSEDDKTYYSSLTLKFGEKRRQFSLGRYQDLQDAIDIRIEVECVYLAKGYSGVVEFIEKFRAEYDTHATRRRSVIVILKDRRLWFRGITDAARYLKCDIHDLGNFLYKKSKSINSEGLNEKIFGVIYSNKKTLLESEISGELSFDDTATEEIDFRKLAGERRAKPIIIGFDTKELRWYRGVTYAASDLNISAAALIRLRQGKLKTIVTSNGKIIYAKESIFSCEQQAVNSNEMRIDLSDLIGKDYHKINAPNQKAHIAVDSNGRHFWFRNAASMCRELGFSNYGLLKSRKVQYLQGNGNLFVAIKESKFLSEELSIENGECPNFAII